MGHTGRYATLYAAARNAIHAVAPSASVIVGGLADDSGTYSASQDYPAQYVQAMFAADPALKGNIDGFGLHPYGAAATDVQSWTVDFRHTLDALGEGSAPIYITELGWTTGDANREFWRAWMLGALATNLSRSDCGIGMVAPYDWINQNDPDGDFGLVGPSGSAPPCARPARPGSTDWARPRRCLSWPSAAADLLATSVPRPQGRGTHPL